METDKFIEACREELTCKHCWATITWSFSLYWGWITSKDALERHERECPNNPESLEWRLLGDIKRCQTIARISDCLNCQHYHIKCDGTKK